MTNPNFTNQVPHLDDGLQQPVINVFTRARQNHPAFHARTHLQTGRRWLVPLSLWWQSMLLSVLRFKQGGHILCTNFCGMFPMFKDSLPSKVMHFLGIRSLYDAFLGNVHVPDVPVPSCWAKLMTNISKHVTQFHEPVNSMSLHVGSSTTLQLAETTHSVLDELNCTISKNGKPAFVNVIHN